MITKEVVIGGNTVTLGCSADTPRQYRVKFGRDLIVDLQKLNKTDLDMTVIENLAYTMAKAGNPGITEDIGEWLSQFGPMDIYSIATPLMEMWTENIKGASSPKKK